MKLQTSPLGGKRLPLHNFATTGVTLNNDDVFTTLRKLFQTGK